MCASYIVILAIFLLPDPHGNPPFSISRDYILDLHLLYLLGLFSVIFSFASDGLGHRRFIPRLELPPQSPPLRRKFLSRSARTINSISRPAYPRRTQPLYPLSVRPRKMPARPRGAQCGCARYRFVLSAWHPTFVHFQRFYPGSFIVHFGDIFVAIIPLRHLVIPSFRHDVFIKKSIFYTFFVQKLNFLCLKICISQNIFVPLHPN